jgi:aminoglycoside phosphotransferase (APT) family kinase protein
MTSLDPCTAQEASPAADAVFGIGDGEDSADGASIVSETPTTEYEQEPYETYRHKASQLILDLFPGYCAEDVQIERMAGGAYNRVIGVTLHKTKPEYPWYSVQGIRKLLQPCLTGRKPKRSSQPKQFILRTPRSPTQSMHHQVTTLAYLGHIKFPYPVPKVVVCDSTAENYLGQAYMLQERLPGQTLSSLYNELNQDQQLSAIRAVSAVILDLAKIKTRCPGIISVRNTTYDLKHDMIRLEPVPIPRSQRTLPSNHLATPQTTKDFLLDIVTRQCAHAATADLPACTEIWERVINMIHTLHRLNFLRDTDAFHLHHGDFHPRNILVRITSPLSVEVTGIIDWDLALFAPKFMATRAPFFAWNSDNGGEEEDGDALLEPEDEETKEIKRAFESVVGEAFLREAYCTELVLLRRLWHILLRGLTNGGDIFLVEEILGEFEVLHSDA